MRTGRRMLPFSLSGRGVSGVWHWWAVGSSQPWVCVGSCGRCFSPQWRVESSGGHNVAETMIECSSEDVLLREIVPPPPLSWLVRGVASGCRCARWWGGTLFVTRLAGEEGPTGLVQTVIQPQPTYSH